MKNTIQKAMLVFTFSCLCLMYGLGQPKKVYTIDSDKMVASMAGRSVVLFDELTTVPGQRYAIKIEGKLTVLLPATYTSQCDPARSFTSALTSSLNLTAPMETNAVLANKLLFIENRPSTSLAEHIKRNPQPIHFQEQFTVAAGPYPLSLQIGIVNASTLICEDKNGQPVPLQVKIIIHSDTKITVRAQ